MPPSDKASSPGADPGIRPRLAAPGDFITLGIVGGGQLAKMTAQAAAQLGCRVVILERHSESPAGSVAARESRQKNRTLQP